MKQYAITGHTSGIGQKLYERLTPNCIGFSLSNGYDIQKKEDRNRILEESANCDVFINNAHCEFAQSQLCLDFWYNNRNKNKIIINVGSRIAEDHIVINEEYAHLLSYSMQKRTLRTLSNDLAKIESLLTVKYKWFGYVNTPKILEKYPHITRNDYITMDEAVNIILSD